MNVTPLLALQTIKKQYNTSLSNVSNVSNGFKLLYTANTSAVFTIFTAIIKKWYATCT